MASYRFLFASLKAPSSILGELPITSASWTHALNSAGSASLSLPLKLSASEQVGITSETLAPGRTAIYVERDGVILWGGILWTAGYDITGNSVSLGCAGWHSYFARRLLRINQTYSAVDQLTIARSLIDYAQGEGGGSLGILTTEATTSGVTRDRSYFHYERPTIAGLIDNLSAVDDGFDFRYDTYYNAGTIETAFRTTFPTRGRETNFVFEAGVNADAASYSCDASRMATMVDALGAGEGENILISVSTDPGLLSAYPLLEDALSFSNVTNVSTLKEHGDYRLARGSAPVCIPSLSVDPNGIPGVGSWLVGDLVTVRLKYGVLNVDERFRITQETGALDASGAETVSLSFAQSGLF